MSVLAVDERFSLDPATKKPEHVALTEIRDQADVVNDALPKETGSTFVLEDHPIDQVRPLRVAVIGAGLAGILAGVLLPAKVPGIALTIFDKNTDVGGTWFENIYPGVRCDIPAHAYQSTFAPKTQWTEQFAQGAEIRDYWQSLARKHQVYKFLKLGHQVSSLDWDDVKSEWRVALRNVVTDQRTDEVFDFVLPAVGRFNDWKLPEYPGVQDFGGLLRHTSNWDPTFDATGKRVAVIGNGASGIQVVPNLQRIAGRVDHYVRSRTWIAASWAGDERTFEPQYFTADQLKSFEDPQTYLSFRKELEEKYWRGFRGLFRGSEENDKMRKDSTEIMKKRLTKKEFHESLIPDFSPHCRRLTPGPGYLEALSAENVDFIQTPIKRFTRTGIETVDGVHREVDAIFCATGANTDCVPPFSITSRGVDLRSAWAPGGKWGFPYTYLGLATPGFPNLLWILGPHASGPSGTVPHAAEVQLTYFAKVLRKATSQGIKSIEPLPEAADDFVEYVKAFFPATVFSENCSSWANSGLAGSYIHGHWPGSAAHLTLIRKDPRWEDWKYQSRSASRNRFAYFGNGWTNKETDLAADMTDYLKLPSQVDLRSLHEDWWE